MIDFRGAINFEQKKFSDFIDTTSQNLPNEISIVIICFIFLYDNLK